MPDGEKIGDGYIEVNFDVDEASAAKAEAAAKAMQARMAADMDRNIDQTTSRQVSAMRALDKQKEDAEAASSIRSARNMANELQQKEKAAADSEKRLSDMEAQADRDRGAARELEIIRLGQQQQKIFEDFDRQRTTTEDSSNRLRNSNAEMMESEKQRFLNMTVSEAAKARDKVESDVWRDGTNKRVQMFSDAISFLPGRMENVFTAMFLNPAGIVIVSAAAVILGNALTSGLLAAVGLADIGGGIALAILGSPRLREMGKQLGSDIFTALKDASSGLERPVMDAMQRMDAAIPMLVAPIKNSFDSLAPAIPALTQGIISFGLQMSAMFGEVSRNLLPVMLVFANEMLPKMGATLRDFFVTLSQNQEATIAGLRMLISTVDGTIIALKYLLLGLQFTAVGTLGIVKGLLDGMAAALDGLARVFPIASGKFHAWADELRGAGNAVMGVTQASGMGTDAMNQYANATAFSTQQTAAKAAADDYAAQKTNLLTNSMAEGTVGVNQLSAAEVALANKVQNAVSQIDQQFDAVHKNIDADQDWNKKLLDLTDAVTQNGQTLDIHTRAGLNNRDALEAAAGASRKLWEEDVASGVPVSEATQRAAERTQQLLKQFNQTGDLTGATQQLIDKYGAIPGDVKTVLELQGYDTTNARLQDLRVQQLSLQQGIPISQAQQTVRDEAKGLGKADGGFITGPGGPTDDSIPARLSNGEFVITAAQTAKHWNLINAIHQDKLMPAEKIVQPMDGVTKFAQGGLVVQNPISQNWPFPVDVSKTMIPSLFFGGAGVQAIQDWLIHHVNGEPYTWGAVGPDTFDCSGLVGEVIARLMGLPNNRRYFVTGDASEGAFLSSHGFTQGKDPAATLIVGYTPSHTMGVIGGLPFEAGSTPIRVGSGTSDINSFPSLWSLKGAPNGGGGFVGAASGALQQYAMSLLPAFGWGADQFGPLQALWNRESNWNPNAVNASSGAYGIPQALGQGHPFNLGDGQAQIQWGLGYIRGRYGSPAAAWGHEQASGWYDNGGYLQPGWNLAYNGLGHPELVQTPEQYKGGGKDVHVYVHDDQVKGLIHCEIKDHEDRQIDSLFRGTGG